MALNASSPSSDVGVMARYFSSANFAPNGFNFEQWKDDQFDAALATLAEATDAATIGKAFRAAHERLVDNPPWLFIVHDLNPRACTDRGGRPPGRRWGAALQRSAAFQLAPCLWHKGSAAASFSYKPPA